MLLYHRVAELPVDSFRLAVTPDRFAEQLEEIRTRFQVFRLTELADAIKAGELQRRSVAITFDDGYVDNLVNAKPLLERYEIPATVFVASGHLGSSRNFWWDDLELLCSKDRGLPIFKIWNTLRPLSDAEREARLDALWRASGFERPTGTSGLDAAGLRDLTRGGLVEIGGHTVCHPQLSTLPCAEQRAEIQTGKDQLEAILGQPIESFAYPYGDHSADSVRCVREIGFKCACAVTIGTIRHGADAYSIPRFPIFNWRGRDFAHRLERLLRD